MVSDASQIPLEESLSPQALQSYHTGKQKKESGDGAFKAGKYKEALKCYHQSLLYLRGLNKNGPAAAMGANSNQGPKNEVDQILEKVYSNMSACYLKLEQWQKTIETADKVLSTNKENHKAIFRKAVAQGEMGRFDKAEVTFTELLKKDPADAPTIRSEMERLRAKDKKADEKSRQKLKGFLKGKDLFADDVSNTNTSDPASPSASASIVEVKDD